MYTIRIQVDTNDGQVEAACTDKIGVSIHHYFGTLEYLEGTLIEAIELIEKGVKDGNSKVT